MGRIRIAGIVALAILLAPVSAPAADLVQLKRDYEAAKKIVDDQKFPGFSIPNTSKAVVALDKEWNTVETWIADSLSGQDTIEQKKLSGIVKGLDHDYDARFVELEPNVFIVGIARGETGSFFALRKMNRQFVVTWRATQVTRGRSPEAGTAQAWTALSATEDCRDKLPAGTWDRCGPLFPTRFGILPKDVFGHSRFFVDAEYAQSAGETVSLQLSIWVWDGEKAFPVFGKSYGQLIDLQDGPAFAGDRLHIQTKEDMKNFSSCGACQGRQANWTIYVKAGTIEDEGSKSLLPQLDAFDELITRIRNGGLTSGIASPEAVALLSPIIAKTAADQAKDNYFSLGMLMGTSVAQDPADAKGSVLCVGSDGDYAPLLVVNMKQKGAQFFITRVRNPGDNLSMAKICGNSWR